MKSNIETYLRLKPILNENENDNKNIKSKMINYQIDPNQKNKISIYIPDDLRQGYINNMKKSYEFKFTGIFEPKTTQEQIFLKLGNKVITNSLEGYNSTIFCYGQTGSGKTYTMCGNDNTKEKGIIPRLLISFFKRIKEEKNKNLNYDVYISYIEIYNENAYDLFDKSHFREPLENWRKIIVYEDNYGNIMLKNMSMIKVENEQQALDLLITGNYIRHASSTSMNLASSRSHAIFSLVIEGKDSNTEIMQISKINLVDLAGSERLKTNNKKEAIFNEAKYINLSLSFLEQVIVSLGDRDKGKISHIPYRNSLMTTILKDSLGGNCKTILIANASSELKFLDETLSTMRFALRCAKVKNEISRNEHMDLNVLVNQLQTENTLLKKKIKEVEKNKSEENKIIDNSKSLPILDGKLSEFEKDECKILISDYLNDKNEIKKINAKNANQLFYIIDFLIEYINNKETNYKNKMTEMINENNELLKLAKAEEEKYRKINEIINKNNLGKYFIETFGKEKNNNNFSNFDDKISIKTENNMNEFMSSIDSENIKNIFANNDNQNLSYNKTNFSNNNSYSNKNKEKINQIPNNIYNTTCSNNNNYIKKNNNIKGIYFNERKLKKIHSFSKSNNNNI